MRRVCLAEARRLLRNREDAEEAVQEALVRAWRRIETCNASEAPLGWLLRITRNESLRLLDRKIHRTAHELSTRMDAEGRSDEDLERALATIAFDQAIAPLPQRDRALMRLRYLHDLSHADLARVLHMPEGTVKVRLHRTRLRLRGIVDRNS